MITYQYNRVNNLSQSDNVKTIVFDFILSRLIDFKLLNNYNQSQKVKGGKNYDNNGIY